MSRALFLFIISFSLSYGWAKAQARVLSLQDAIELAQRQSYESLKADIELRKSKKNIFLVMTTGFPQVSLTSGYSRSFDIPTQSLPDFISPAVIRANQEYFGLKPIKVPDKTTYFPVRFGQNYNSNFNITVSQLIFDGSYLVALRGARVAEALQQHSTEKTWQMLKQTVMQGYYLALVAEQHEKSLQEVVNTTKQVYRETDKLYQNGFREKTEVSQMELLFNQAEQELFGATVAKKNAYRSLNFILGNPIDDPLQLTDSLSRFIAAVDTGIRPFDPSQNIDVQLATSQLESKRLLLRNEKMQLLPIIKASYAYGRSSFGDDPNLFSKEWYPSSSLGISATWKLFTSFGRKAKIDIARLDWKLSGLSLEQTQRQITHEALSKHYALLSAYKKHQNTKTAEQLAASIYSNTEKKFREGMSSGIELATVQQQYFQSYIAYVQAVIELLNAEVAYKRVLGTL